MSQPFKHFRWVHYFEKCGAKYAYHIFSDDLCKKDDKKLIILFHRDLNINNQNCMMNWKQLPLVRNDITRQE